MKKENNSIKLYMRSIVFFIGSIIGSGVLILPYIIKTGGLISFFIAMSFVTFITYIFTKILCITTLLKKVFGKRITVILTFLYWLISWVSTSVVINEAVYYISQLFTIDTLLLQCTITIFFIIINCISNKHTVYLEYILTALKVLLLIIFPIVVLFKSSMCVQKLPMFYTSNGITNIFWCFLGIEMGSIMHLTTRNGLISILFIGILYLINIFAIMLNIPEVTIRAFFDLSQMIFGNTTFIAISIIILCLSTINSWIVASSTFAYESSINGAFPEIFSRKSNDIPVYSTILSSIGLIPLFFVLRNDTLSSIILHFANLSSNLFLFFYGVVIFAFGRDLTNNMFLKLSCYVLSIILILFCVYTQPALIFLSLIICLPISFII